MCVRHTWGLPVRKSRFHMHSEVFIDILFPSSKSFNSLLLGSKYQTFFLTITWHLLFPESCISSTLMQQFSTLPTKQHPPPHTHTLKTPAQTKYLSCEILKVDSSAVQVRGLTVTWNQIMTVACDYTVPGRVPCR